MVFTLCRRIGRRLRSVSADRGSNVVELAVLAPALMMLCMLILQFGLWFNARQVALAAAQAGATVAREEAATQPGPGQPTRRNAATSYYGEPAHQPAHQVSRRLPPRAGAPMCTSP